MDAGRN